VTEIGRKAGLRVACFRGSAAQGRYRGGLKWRSLAENLIRRKPRTPRQRAANFGLALLDGQPVTSERVAESLDRYNAAEVSRVADLVRAEAGIDAALDGLEEQYRLAVAEGSAPLAEIVADASAHLVKLKALTFHFEQERDAALTRLVDVEAHNGALSSWAAELHAKLTRLEVPFQKRLRRKIRDAVTPKRSPQ
jgi:hypothetical protein